MYADGISDQYNPEIYKQEEAEMSLLPRMVRIVFTPRYFEPHWTHFYDDPVLLWLLVLGNAVISLAYICIPIALVYFLRKRKDTVFQGLINLYGAFIILCSLTHFMMIVIFWYPVYWLEMILLWATGIVSLITFFSMLKFIPIALNLKTPKELEDLNEQLASEVEHRKQVEEELREREQDLKKQKEQIEQALAASEKSKQDLKEVNDALVGRELKMTELKQRIEQLEKQH